MRTSRVVIVSVVAGCALLGAAGCGHPAQSGPGALPPPPIIEAAPGGIPSVVWQTATDPGSGVSVQLAGIVTSEIKPLPGRPGQLHGYEVVIGKDGLQRLNVADVDGQLPYSALPGIVQEIAKQSGGTVTESHPITVSGHPGTDFQMVVTWASQPTVLLGRLVFTPTKMVQLITGVVQSKAEEASVLQSRAVASLRVP